MDLQGYAERLTGVDREPRSARVQKGERRGFRVMTDLFSKRVAIHRTVDQAQGYAIQVLNDLRGLGIEGTAVKATAAFSVGAKFFLAWVNPYQECEGISNAATKRMLHAAFDDLRPGWNDIGETWVWLEHQPDGERPRVDGCTSARGGEEAVWKAIRSKFFKRLPCANMATTPSGNLRVSADRPTNVRSLTASERRVSARIAGYVRTTTGVSVLLYGPQGSAKTTMACSVAYACTGGYFRLNANHVCAEMAHALAQLRPGAVIIDDIDRSDDVALLDFLDALSAADVITICTSNTSPDNRHDDEQLMDAALVRSGRMDIHIRIAGLDPESHAEICRSVGLTGVDLGSRGGELLASDLACLGRMHRAGDLSDPSGVVADLLQRRTNKRHTLSAVPMLTAKSNSLI